MHPTGGSAAQHLSGMADPVVVLVAFVAAVAASFLALELAGRTLGADAPPRRRSLLAGGAAMGGGLWAMHLLSMSGLADGLDARYRTGPMAAALLVAVAGATLALAVVARPTGGRRSLLLAAPTLGVAVIAMQYLAMAGLDVGGRLVWAPSTIVLSTLLGVGGSALALAPVTLGGTGPSWRVGRRLAAAVGIGLTGQLVHQTGTRAVTLVGTPGLERTGDGVGISAIAALLGLAASVVLLVITIDAGRQKRRAEAAADLAIVTQVAREFGRRGDVRVTVCDTALALVACDFVVLLEPGPDGTLSVRGTAGEDPDRRIAGTSRASIAAAVLESGIPRFVPDVRRETGADLEAVSRTGVVAALFEPVVLDDRAVGVLMAGWTTPVGPPADRVVAVIALLAAESAVAIERADLVDRLTRLALVDGLTGLPNRRAIGGALDAALAAAGRTGQPVTVAMADVDRFKAFNDDHGHLAGDRLLADLAAGWLAEVRAHDVVGRYGGEEFLLLLPGLDSEDASLAVERLRARTPGPATCSFGLATWDGQEGPTALVERADGALYAAKRAGRDRVVAA